MDPEGRLEGPHLATDLTGREVRIMIDDTLEENLL